MKTLLRRHTTMAISAALAAIAVTAAFFSFLSSMKIREARVIEARDRVASFEQNRITYSKEAEELEAIKTRIVSLEAHVLTAESIPPLLSELEAIAKSSSVKFTINGVENQSTVEGKPQRLHIDFSAEGSFAAISRFVDTLRSQSYQAAFTRFSLYATGGEKASGASWQLLAGIDIISF